MFQVAAELERRAPARTWSTGATTGEEVAS
jgi:hypothetical protein